MMNPHLVSIEDLLKGADLPDAAFSPICIDCTDKNAVCQLHSKGTHTDTLSSVERYWEAMSVKSDLSAAYSLALQICATNRDDRSEEALVNAERALRAQIELIHQIEDEITGGRCYRCGSTDECEKHYSTEFLPVLTCLACRDGFND